MLPFDPNQYDIFYLGISGGKDSTALLLWSIYESGLDKDKIRAKFCDTGNEDSLTYAYIQMLREIVFSIGVLKPEKDFYELAAVHRRFPSRMGRFCTMGLKIVPSREYVLNLMQQGKRVLLVNGVRKSEAHSGNNRGEVPELGYDDGYACDVYRPLLNWSIEQIWDIHKKYLPLYWVTDMVKNDPNLSPENKVDIIGKIENHRIPRNPLYDMGARRVGCFPCINSSKPEVRAMAKYRPERIDFIDEKEKTIGGDRGFASMFVPKMVPERFRSKTWVREKDGKEFKIATIRDVVECSKTGARARGVASDDDIPLCDSSIGACE